MADSISVLTIGLSGSGSVSARMHGTAASNCINDTDQATCQPTCTLNVQTVCEFHCQHDHTSPFAWRVRLVGAPSVAGETLRAWHGNCAPAMDASRENCLILMNADQSVTAVFGPADTVPPTAPFASSGGSTPYTATINWSPAIDDAWLGGYEIIRDGALVARMPAGATTFKVENLSCERTYMFRVDAYDTRNSTASNSVPITTGQCLRTAGPVPNTIIHVKPPRSTRSRTAFFHFGVRGSVPATKFQCKLDRGRWVRCSGRTGKRYRSLKRGYHTFRVRAGNAYGFDRTPAIYRWRIR